MLNNNYSNDEEEIVKLISFAYDLYEDKLDFFSHDTYLFPRLYSYNHNSYDTVRIPGGIVWGKRGYANHSDSTVFTNLGLSVGQVENDNLEFEYAIMFAIDNKRENVHIELMKKVDNKDFQPELEYDHGAWDKLSKEEKVNLFVRSMVILGFNENDVRGVLNGIVKPRDAYINIAPDDKKYKQWINVGRRYYTFVNNIGISGHFGYIRNFDTFPFPFDGEVIIDCSSANTSCIELNENKRKVRLINVNKNKDSVWHADLRNAIIDEVIDLSCVDAKGTKFGHHKLSFFEYSRTKVTDMDLTLACDENGNRFKVDEKGVAEVNFFGEPTIVETSEKSSDLEVLVNVDTPNMIEQILNINYDGLGLVRTETSFYSTDRIQKYVKLFLDYKKDKKLLEEFKQEQKELLNSIIGNFTNKNITIRLFDFRFIDLLKNINIKPNELDEICDSYYNFEQLMELRGAKYLYENEEIMTAQLESIFELCNKYRVGVNIIIPYVKEIKYLQAIKYKISEINERYKINYRLGAMIENLNSANNADNISKLVDFISIGLNDLTESITGKSRECESSEFFYLNDEMKSVINETIYRARAGKNDIQIGICGEHTSYLENLEFFKSIGISYISVEPFSFSSIKEKLLQNNNPILKLRKETKTNEG